MGTVLVHFQKIHSRAIALAFVTSLGVAENADAAPRLEDLARRVGVTILADATSEKEVLQSTTRQIPYRKMSRNAQTRATYILNNISQYRRMPSLQYPINPDIYQYLINHPDVAISTWRVMGISTLQMWQTDEFEYEAKATDGSTGTADVLWRDGNQCLFIVEGRYESPLLPGSIEASALVWLQFRFVKAKDGSLLVNQQVETFVHFPSTAIDTIAKLTSRLTNSILDRNVFEVSLYARMMTKAAEKEPQWIGHLARRLEGVPQERGRELASLARRQNPTATDFHAVSSSRQPGPRSLPASGEFRAFEKSLQQVTSHVPLVPRPVQHAAPNSQQVNPNQKNMARPYQFISPERPSAATTETTFTRLAVHYGNPHPHFDTSITTGAVSSTAVNEPSGHTLKSLVPRVISPLTSSVTSAERPDAETTSARSENSQSATEKAEKPDGPGSQQTDVPQPSADDD